MVEKAIQEQSKNVKKEQVSALKKAYINVYNNLSSQSHRLLAVEFG